MSQEANHDKRALALQLFDIESVKFGDFVTKIGIRTPVYFDLRVIVSHPSIMSTISNMLYKFAVKEAKYDHLCGVPYTALPIATLLSVEANKPMLMRRKEAKSYGTKKMIEGHYKAGDTCLIIEDVVTSGASVLETVNDLKKEGLVTKEAIIILDRQQGGIERLRESGIETRSLFSLTELVNILVDEGKIDKEVADSVGKYLRETQVPTVGNGINSKEIQRTKLSYEDRAKLAKNSVASKLFEIMAIKKTNLCLSVDLTTSSSILDLIEKVGPHVCLVKTHVDLIEDFSEDFIKQLTCLARKHNFLIMEDRKYADIGNTVGLQYSKGLYRVAEWADLVTAHALPGAGLLEGILRRVEGRQKGVFLLAQMSSQGNLITPQYTEETMRIAEKFPSLVAGVVCQHGNVVSDPGLIQLTPGVKLESAEDNLGQVYNTPETVVLTNGADIAVVGRGILQANNPQAEAELYKQRLWECYETRIKE